MEKLTIQFTVPDIMIFMNGFDKNRTTCWSIRMNYNSIEMSQIKKVLGKCRNGKSVLIEDLLD